MEGFISSSEVSYYYKALKPNTEEELITQVGPLYHYTSTEVLDKILSNATFWASNIFYLNDSSEFRAGINKMRECFLEGTQNEKKIAGYFDEIEKYDGKSWPGLYTISFSNKYDELQQWTTYAKESGVCIELDCDRVKGDLSESRLLLMQKSADGTYIPASENYNGFGGLSYISNEGKQKNEEMIKIAHRIFNEFVNIWDSLREIKTIKAEDKARVWEEKKQAALQYLTLLASYYKVRGFYGEGEIRITFFPLEMIDPFTGETKHAEIKYRQVKNGILRPYLEIYFFQGTNPVPKCPIKSILIGPSGKQQNVYDSVVHRLKYGEVNVWDYPVQERAKILKEYIDVCIESLPDGADDVLKCEIYHIIAESWCNGCRGITYERRKGGRKNAPDLRCDNNTIILLQGKKAGSVRQEELAKIHKIAEKYVEDFMCNEFLSQHGIWVKKSQIPYIY